MTHLDPSTLTSYNSLADPHLQSYFSNERIRSHLKHAGLISNHGEIIADSEYRTRLAHREHRQHVKRVLAENIVHRAIDNERARQADMRRKLEFVTKATLVNNIKESRRRSVNLGGGMGNACDLGLLSIDSACFQTRPKSANHQNEDYNEYSRIPRIRSAHIKSSSKNSKRHRPLRRTKSSNKRRSPSLTKSSCQITMVYYGPHTKVDYDHLVFESTDEILVMQQHCGGENLIVYKDYLQPGDLFTFESRRHSNYPFGLSLYINGLIDSRISTCCEYKHRHGVRLGGDRGHFAIKLVHGSTPCVKCRYEKQARLRKYAQSPKEKDDENKKPIIIPLPVSQQHKTPQTPVKIPVRLSSDQNENYSEDFEHSDKQKRLVKDDSSIDLNKNKQKSKAKIPERKSSSPPKGLSRRSSSTIDATPTEESNKKTWQIQFHTLNISTGNFQFDKSSSKNLLLKISFLSKNQKTETEINELDMKQLIQDSKSSKQFSFQIKFINIGKPEFIRLQLYTTNDDDNDDDDDIKWHLDHIELIDPQTQSRLIFPCKQWIRPLQQKILRLSPEVPENERKRRTSTSSSSSSSDGKVFQQPKKIIPKTKSPSSKDSRSSGSDRETHQVASKPVQKPKLLSPSSNDSRPSSSNQKTHQQPPKIVQKEKTSARSSTSSKSSKKSLTKNDSPHRMSPDVNANLKQKQKRSGRSSVSSEKSQTKIDSAHRTFPDADADEKQKEKTSARSSTSSKSSKKSQTKIDSPHRTSSDIETNEKQKSSPIKDKNLIHYKITIYPSEDADGDLYPNENSRIYIRLNNQSEEIKLTDKHNQSCPTFDAGKEQTFQFDSTENQQLKTLTIGYFNSSNNAKTWKLKKIVITNTNTDATTTFICERILERKQGTSLAENTYEIQSDESANDHTPRNEEEERPQIKNQQEEQQTKHVHEQSAQSSERQEINENPREKSPSFQSMTDEEAHYSKIFKVLDPKNEFKLGSSRSPTPQPEPKSVPITTTDNINGRFKKMYPSDEEN